MPKINKTRNGIAFLLLLIGLSTSKIIGVVLGAILGAFLAYSTAELTSPSYSEVTVWCIAFSLLGLFVGSIVDMPNSRKVKPGSEPGSTDPKYFAPDDFNGDSGSD